LDDGGYIMVVLLIGIAVSAVWMGAMLPAWRHQAIRQKEADLIFRGEQYARAIALYWRKNNQTLPPSIDVLVSQRYLRNKYLDPITGKEFLTVGGTGLMGGIGGGRGQGQSAGRGQVQPPASGQGPFGASAGISGVRSTSTATSIVVYRGQTAYSQFPFDYTFALQRMGGGMPQLGPQGPFGPGRGRGAGAPVERGVEIPPEFPGRGRGAPPMQGPPGGGRIGN
jgi:hypothetical protein